MADGLPTYSAVISSADNLSINPDTANIVQTEPTSHEFLNPLLNNTNHVGSNMLQFQSGGMGNVKSTPNMYRAPTMINPELDNIENYICWSIINIFCCCFFLGLVACYYSSKTDGLIKSRNFQGALKASKNARSINTVATVLGKTFYVSNFGAYPNDNIDDTKAIQVAIDTAINELNSTVIFGYGIYNLSSTITISEATNLTIQGQGIDQTFLIGNVPLTIFSVLYCNGLTISSLSIDFDPLSFTAGYVVNVNDAYIDVRVQSPHQPDIGRQIKYIIRYDPVEMRPAYGWYTYAVYQDPPLNANTSLVSPNVLRLPLALPASFSVGDAVVAHYINGNNGIFAYGATDFTVESVTMYTSWAMGFFTIKIRRFNVINFHIVPRNGRWLSSSSDCMHFVNAKEYVNIINSKCEATADDGLNIFRPFYSVVEIMNSNAILVKTAGTDPFVEIGEHLEFTSNKQPFTVYATGTVVSSESRGPDKRLLTFTNSINASVGDWLCNADTPTLTIRNFTVQNNRARGVVLETRNIDIRNSVFNRTSAPAVLIQPSTSWQEGPEARNISLINNLYINCNEGIGQQQGIIASVPDPIQLVPVINDIRIESSTFYFRNYSENLLESFNVNNLYFSDNYIATNVTTSIISLCNTRNITASNNTLVNKQGKIEQYYHFETRHGCQMNLSSLIDLPPSAFNSSFPPPV